MKDIIETMKNLRTLTAIENAALDRMCQQRDEIERLRQGMNILADPLSYDQTVIAHSAIPVRVSDFAKFVLLTANSSDSQSGG